MKSIATALVVLFIAVGTAFVDAAEQPDAKINPLTGKIELVDPVWTGTDYDIRYVVNPGRMATTYDLATDPADDNRPQMAFAPDGDAWVVWWRDAAIPQVLLRRHQHATDSWSAEVALGDAATPGSNPEVAHDGARAYIAFEARDGEETGIKISIIEGDPDPFPVHEDLASTTFEGDVDLRVHTKAGSVWVTWRDSLSEVGWCEYDPASSMWSLPGYAGLGASGLSAALEQIEITVVGN